MGTRELIGIQIAQDARRANTVNIYRGQISHRYTVGLPLGGRISRISRSRVEKQMSVCVQISWNLYRDPNFHSHN